MPETVYHQTLIAELRNWTRLPSTALTAMANAAKAIETLEARLTVAEYTIESLTERVVTLSEANTNACAQIGELSDSLATIEAIKKESYKRGWNDREDDIINRAERILPQQ